MIDLYKYTDKEIDELVKSMIILIDTREHDGKNAHILKYFDKAGINYKKKKLDYGDYSFMIPACPEKGILKDLNYSSKIIVERKASLEELAGNLTQSRDRLEKELALAPNKKVILLEGGSYADVVMGNYKTNYGNKSYWASLHSFWHKYDIPVFFMPDPKFSGMFIRGYFEYYLRNILK